MIRDYNSGVISRVRKIEFHVGSARALRARDSNVYSQTIRDSELIVAGLRSQLRLLSWKDAYVVEGYSK